MDENKLGKEFKSYAQKHRSITSLQLNNFDKNYITPNIIEERQLNVAIMSVYDRLLMDRILFLSSEINSDVTNIMIAQLLFLESVDNKKDINLMVSSPGGSVNSGMALINTMEYISCDVSTTVVGLAASMGAVILSAGQKGKRFGLKNSRVMIHQISSGTEGKISDMEIAFKETRRTKKELYDELVRSTGQTYQQIEKDCDSDYWMTTEEAKDYGLIDKVLVKNDIKTTKK